MRTLCDVCVKAAAILFCAADEAALCKSCDDKIHTCNKLASRHVRVGIAEPSKVPSCDICENAPAFFYCEIDGTSLCLQCDMIVHVGGKRTHARYLLLRQRVEFPGDKLDEPGSQRNQQNHRISPDPTRVNNNDTDEKRENKMIDLNSRPQRVTGQPLPNQERAGTLMGNHHDSEGLVPDGYFKRELDK